MVITITLSIEEQRSGAQGPAGIQDGMCLDPMCTRSHLAEHSGGYGHWITAAPRLPQYAGAVA